MSWRWAKVSPAIVAALGGLLFWRRRRRSVQPPSWRPQTSRRQLAPQEHL